MQQSELDETLRNATRALLEARNAKGHWEGELSSSALSTATAAFTFHLYLQRRPHASHVGRVRELMDAGLRWLASNLNADGGWGDTTLSFSNISTTTLCWAAFAPFETQYASTLTKAEAWLEKAAGSLKPPDLARAIIARYGKDKTFSVPILTMSALAGRVGWELIPQLPFELAALPHELWTTIKLPVVSYALPALIAMGHVRHEHKPTWNPIARALRAATSGRTLETLRGIQPKGGGFLEATPLTSFVTMSLLACEPTPRGEEVIADGIDFLIRSARPDGSWPIDTNLATWVTTLSVNALAEHPEFNRLLPPHERTPIIDWLLGQQYKVEHPYTHAAPGGWAWTDLPGGVPDADDTAGALIALRHLAPKDPAVKEAAGRGVDWLISLQNRDGGIPTFCRGWGNLPFDRSGPDLTAHAICAWSAWDRYACLPPNRGRFLSDAAERGVDYLYNVQREDGAWSPLWFGCQHALDDENLTYGTARVTLAFSSNADLNWRPYARALSYLAKTQNANGGWGGARGAPSTIEETSLGLGAFAQAWIDRGRWGDSDLPETSVLQPVTARAAFWLAHATEMGRRFDPAPIGLYFAKLWYYERLYPVILAVGALGRANTMLGNCHGQDYLPVRPTVVP